MRTRIISRTGVLQMNQSIIMDRFKLWDRFDCDELASAEGYEIIHIEDDMKLRYYYETVCQNEPGSKRIIVITAYGFHVPYDIEHNITVVKLGFPLLFPSLDEKALLSLPGIDFDHLAFVADSLGVRKKGTDETISFCVNDLQQKHWAWAYADALLQQAVNLAESATSHRTWIATAIAFSKAARFQHSGIEIAGFGDKRDRIESAFANWISKKYAMLSGTVDSKRPVLLSKVNDFIRKGNRKIALIVMDGMSFENFFTIKQAAVNEPLTYDIQASFSFFPTVTSIARQSLFSGRLPREHIKPFSLENEEKQWLSYWSEHGYRNNEIGFYKNDVPEILPSKKVIGIVVNICDDLMHDELQGHYGLNQGIENWIRRGSFAALVKNLLRSGFAVFLTADHGNTAAIAEGRFQKPGVLAEPASRRAVIYRNYAEALELAKFSTVRYNGAYLPDGYDAYLFEDARCYGDQGKEYITHGGMTLEETVVPFVRIGEFYG